MHFSPGQCAVAQYQELVGGEREDARVVADQQERSAQLVAQTTEEGRQFHNTGGIQ
jgi:hypothetical protein